MLHPVIGLAHTELAAYFQLGLDPERLVAAPFVADVDEVPAWAQVALQQAHDRRLVVSATVETMRAVSQALGGRDAVIIVVGDADALLRELGAIPADMNLDDDGKWHKKLLDHDTLNDILAVAHLEGSEAPSPGLQEAMEEPEALPAAPPIDPRQRGIPLHLRNRPAPPVTAPASPAPAVHEVRVLEQPGAPPAAPATFTAALMKLPPPPPVPDADLIRASKDHLCEVLQPFLVAGPEVFTLAARYAVGKLEVDAWVGPVRMQAACRGVRELEMAAVGLYRLSSARPNTRDKGVAAIMEMIQ